MSLVNPISSNIGLHLKCWSLLVFLRYLNLYSICSFLVFPHYLRWQRLFQFISQMLIQVVLPINLCSSSIVTLEPVRNTTTCASALISGIFLLRNAANAAAPDGSTTRPPSYSTLIALVRIQHKFYKKHKMYDIYKQYKVTTSSKWYTFREGIQLLILQDEPNLPKKYNILFYFLVWNQNNVLNKISYYFKIIFPYNDTNHPNFFFHITIFSRLVSSLWTCYLPLAEPSHLLLCQSIPRWPPCLLASFWTSLELKYI